MASQTPDFEPYLTGPREISPLPPATTTWRADRASGDSSLSCSRALRASQAPRNERPAVSFRHASSSSVPHSRGRSRPPRTQSGTRLGSDLTYERCSRTTSPPTFGFEARSSPCSRASGCSDRSTRRATSTSATRWSCARPAPRARPTSLSASGRSVGPRGETTCDARKSEFATSTPTNGFLWI